MVEKEGFAALQKQAENDGIQKIVVGAMITREGKFLIVQRASTESFMAGLDEIPSGTVDPGEGLGETLVREVHEETGLTISEVTAYANSFDYKSGSGKNTRQYNFIVEVEDGDVTLNPAEHSKHWWLDPKSLEFAALNISAETSRCIHEANERIKKPDAGTANDFPEPTN